MYAVDTASSVGRGRNKRRRSLGVERSVARRER
jgi:hypothetical protein